ncbi:hypothetical protein AJ87_03910 [Rhizobium yanglingense]|nr:hypothetical protein AJ87_03910 [Rhizobium yanglingense]
MPRDPSDGIGYLDEIAVRIAEIDGADSAVGAGAFDGSFLDCNIGCFQMRDDLGECCFGDKAEIRRTRYRLVGFGIEFAPGLVKVDLLIAEFQRLAALGNVSTDMPRVRR